MSSRRRGGGEASAQRVHAGFMRLIVVLVCAGLTPGGCARRLPETGPTAIGPSSSSQQDFVRVLDLHFDDVQGLLPAGSVVADSTGHTPGGTVRLGGTDPQPVQVIAGVSGNGIRLVQPCADRRKDCHRAVVEVPDAPVLRPVRGDIRFGASVLLTTSEVSAGSNVLQKGFSNGGDTQWKLQVDGAEGKPSCVLVGRHPTELAEAIAPTSVTDGTWHQVTCQRSANDLTISVDGTEVASAIVPPGMVVDPGAPVRVGGKNTDPDNDQFLGAVDDVFVEVPRTRIGAP